MLLSNKAQLTKGGSKVTDRQRKSFKKKLIDDDLTMKQFCLNNRLDYNVFNQELNGHQPAMRAKHEDPVLRYIGETPPSGE